LSCTTVHRRKDLPMKSKLAAFSIAAALAAYTAVPAFAAPGDIGDQFSGAEPGTVGPLISGVIYGNTSNPSGNGSGVLPSFSPGPWICGNPADCAGPTDPGGSMGTFIAPIASDGQATPVFANGNDPDIDFSLH
jgi:hypothetical protein